MTSDDPISAEELVLGKLHAYYRMRLAALPAEDQERFLATIQALEPVEPEPPATLADAHERVAAAIDEIQERLQRCRDVGCPWVVMGHRGRLEASDLLFQGWEPAGVLQLLAFVAWNSALTRYDHAVNDAREFPPDLSRLTTLLERIGRIAITAQEQDDSKTWRSLASHLEDLAETCRWMAASRRTQPRSSWSKRTLNPRPKNPNEQIGEFPPTVE